MKVKVRCGRVVDMSKTMDPAEADGENLGIVKFGADGRADLVGDHGPPGRRRRLRAGRRRAFREFARVRPLHAVGTRGLPWIEIDFPEDYQRAVREVLPAIEATVGTEVDDRTGDEQVTRSSRADSGRRAIRRSMLPHADADQAPTVRQNRHRGMACRAWSRSAAALACRTCCAVCARCCFAEDASSSTRERLVAIVATSDDGGSSGRLRAEFNIIPPGDIRNCLAALSDNNSQIADIFQYRFGAGDGLNGHAIGNLVLTALADVTNDFTASGRNRRAGDRRARRRAAGDERAGHAGRGVRRRPGAERRDGDRGGAAGRIARLSLLPDRPRCSPQVTDAMHQRRRDRRRARAACSPASCRRCWCRQSADAIRPLERRSDSRRQPDDRAGRDRRFQRARSRADDRAASRAGSCSTTSFTTRARCRTRSRRAYAERRRAADRSPEASS